MGDRGGSSDSDFGSDFGSGFGSGFEPDFEYEILGPDDGDPSPGRSGSSSVSPAGSPPSASPSGPPGRSALLVGGVLALAALIVGLLAFGSPGQWSREVATRPTPSPSPAATSPDQAEFNRWTITGPDVSPAAPRIQLSVVPLCAPVTDGGTKLLVAFQVVNSGSTAFTLTDVAPRLPKRGLVRLQKVWAGGSCEQPGDEPVGRVLAPTQRALVTMQLKLLDTCPKPAPFGVRVRADFVSGPSSLSFPLFADLGSVAFSGC